VLATINVGVEHTQDVLELGIFENERHSVVGDVRM
jgi:hypothetical protein